MKVLVITCALIAIATAAILPDSATQGPNPQDIATPEPEYIDIDLPESAPPPPPPPQSAPRAHLFSTSPKSLSAAYSSPVVQQLQQPQFFHEFPGHYNGPSGYQYRRPVYIRRIYRRHY